MGYRSLTKQVRGKEERRAVVRECFRDEEAGIAIMMKYTS